MHWNEIRNHRFFELPPDQSRSLLRWARILALVLGIATLYTAVASFALADRAMASGLLVYALVLLVLGPRVGRGDIRAAAVLLGLAFFKLLTARSSFILLPIVEIWIFGQAFRGAVALSPRTSSAADASPDVGEWSANARRSLNEAFDRAPQGSVLDFLVGVLLLAAAYRSYRWMEDVPGGNLFGFGVVVLFFVFVAVILALLLLTASVGAVKGRRWVQRVRAFAYVPLFMLCALGSPLIVEMLKDWLR